MNEKIKKLFIKILLSILGVILINLFSICAYIGISGLLYSSGFKIVDISYISISCIIIGIVSFIFSLLYIILINIKFDNISNIISFVTAIIFAYCMSSAYSVYFSDLSSALLGGVEMIDELINMGLYVVIGLLNIFIFTYTYIYSILLKIFKKIHK